MALAALVLASVLSAPCTTSDAHERWAMKTRRAPAVLPASLPRLSVTALLGWDVPAVADTRATAPVDAREQHVYTLVGYPRLAKLSADDCDVHVQVADTPDGDVQVIVELPANEPEARAALAAILGAFRSSPHRFTAAPRLAFTGYAFLDLSHQTNPATQAGHAHGSKEVRTLWELHPTFRVERAP